MKKDKLTKEAQTPDNKINELAKKPTRKFRQVQYQFHGTGSNPKVSQIKKQKWILVNKQGRFSGILDHIDFDTREKAKLWFQRTSDMFGGTINIDDLYYVLKNEEYKLLKELDAFDKLDAIDMVSDLDVN
tara:strand:- start:145 stop:534 length:390 start_codon:yes stop_codon:yes gene_type:complete